MKMNLGKPKSDEDDSSAISFESLSSRSYLGRLDGDQTGSIIRFLSHQDGKSEDLYSQLSLRTFDRTKTSLDSSHSDSLFTELLSSHYNASYNLASNKVTPGSEPILNQAIFHGPSRGTNISSSHQTRVRGENPPEIVCQKKRVLGTDPWMIQYKNLKAFYRIYGHCMVPQKYQPDRRLGIWVNKQRMEFKKRNENKPSSMTNERLALLEGIGFVWAKKKGTAAWDARLVELQQYKAVNGDCNVYTKTSLGRWVSLQRQQYKLWLAKDSDCTLDEQRIQQLENLGFNWRL